LKNLQNGEDSFKAVVSISSLRTRSDKEPVTVPESLEPRNIGTITAIQPPHVLTEDIEDWDINIESENEDEDSISERNEENVERSSGFTQQLTDILPSHILADVFYEIDKVCRTISKKHTLCQKFATAFSDTLLVPDKNNKKAMSEILEKKGIKYAVVPLHTEDEFNLFHSAVSPGGQYASAYGLPNFDQMV
jgi:hypothetical protein